MRRATGAHYDAVVFDDRSDDAMIRFVLHLMNVFLMLAMVGCVAGALAGLIVLFPLVAGAWGLNLMALLAYEENWHGSRA